MIRILSEIRLVLALAVVLGVLTGCPGVPEPPAADFQATPRSGTIPLYVAFADMSTVGTAALTGWSWDFGDGSPGSVVRNPNHVYQIPGTYTVTLTVTARDGRTDFETKDNYIVASTAAPVADFSANPRSGPAPLEVQFTDTSDPGTADIDTWQWTFGDGATSFARNPDHTYTSPGSYDVSLRVVSAHGEHTTTQLDFIVVDAVPPTAAFSVDHETGLAPQWVRFSDESAAGTSAITSWLWDFGDSTTSEDQNPTHLYEAAGSYLVSLTVQGADGDSTEEKTDFIVLEESPVPMTSIAEGWFEMGGRVDHVEIPSDTKPRHYVYLNAFSIALYEVTNAEYADMLNWAKDRDYIVPSGGNVFVENKLAFYLSSATSPVVFENGSFAAKTQLAGHPVVEVTWYGAAAYCNWLSEQLGLVPCYNLETWERVDPLPNGLRLPTEAEWERAAGWDDTLNDVILPEWGTGGQWLYGFGSDDILATRCNYGLDNPLGMNNFPYTTTVGYYDGINAGTENSVSPAGCYDMSGNAGEWVHDRYEEYASVNQTNPLGATSTSAWRVWRGGSWSSQDAVECSSAYRNNLAPTSHYRDLGFRVAR